MDYPIASLYSEILAHQNPVMDFVRKDNFILVRVIGHDYCKETYSIFLKPQDVEEEDPQFLKFKSWANQEYPNTCCYCYDDYDYDDSFYDDVEEEIDHKLTKQERREMKNKKWRDKKGNYKW